MFAALTGAGLSAAAGLNAYVPFLIVALISRFTDVINLPSSFQWIENPWVIGASVVLLALEVVLDKIPGVDSVNDIVGTAVRPTIGGVVAAATTAPNALDNSTFMHDNPWIAGIGGALIAGVVHAGKATVRPAINIASLGVGAPIVSASEDVTSVGLSFVAIFLPILVIIGLVLLAWAIFAILRRARRFARCRQRAELAT
ncbi:DUF4126 domain-containing protein [Calidifontibacter sp. DB0510]|uniref:DUF4126 domain-containing protein n=1 Tax=Metallococcus carri TaxID=1656884 RepID=A0A967E8V4_9MICO|nr:DUF4126 domain-containing protein [Metallococcus carri]NHN55652.1 DUF4126 domain-containing protein [Metallococcus carri]NOP38164.1 DUF4126 domain-containing protein [Calidifontibacter sp. DB2511S]